MLVNRDYVIEGAGGGGGKGGGGGQSRVAQEAPNTLVTKNIARIVDLIGEGINGGLVDGLKSVFLDETPIIADDGSENFRGISVQERLGSPDQNPVAGFSEVEEERSVGVQVTTSAPVIRAVTDPDIDSIRIKIQFPALFLQNTSSGDISATSVNFRISRRPDGGTFELVHDITISDKTNTVQELGYRVSKPDGVTGSWDWQVERVTADSQSSALKNDTFVSSITLITESRLYYPYSHIIAIEADAEQFGDRIPARSYRIRGQSAMQIPTDYNPETRTYSEQGMWDGSFKTGYTNNPAWVLYNILANSLWGLGEFIAAEHLSQLKWDCYTAGRHCDELVPDGNGGMEPRFVANGVIARQEDAIKVLGSITSVFRGMAYWSAGGVMLTNDRPKTAYRLVNQTNVLEGRFGRPGESQRGRVTSVKVAWNNPEDNFRLAIEVVDDHAAIRRFGQKSAQHIAFMCTSRGQARRVGRWVLQSQSLTHIVFRAGSDLADLRPGDVVKIMDPEEVGVRLGGRVISGTLDQIELDAPVTLAPGEVYTLDVRLPDGGTEQRTVVTSPGETTTLDLSAPLPVAPSEAAIWLLYSDSVEPELARIVTVSEVDKDTYQFECLSYNPTLFDEVDQIGEFSPLQTSLVPSGPLPVPTELQVTESLVLSGPTVGAIAEVDWRQSTDMRVRNTEVQIQRPGDSFKSLPLSPAPPLTVREVVRGNYAVRARFVDGFGRRGSWAVISKPLFGLAAPPDPLTGLRIQRLGGVAILSWNETPNLDVKIGGQIHVRHSVKDEGLPSSLRMTEPLPGSSTQAIVPLIPGTYYVFARDSGDRAGPVAKIATDDSEALNFSTIGFVQANPVWGGQHENTVELNGTLQLATMGSFAEIPNFAEEPSIARSGGAFTDGTYTMAGPINLGSVKDVRVTTEVETVSLNLLDSFSGRPGSFAEWPSFAGLPLAEVNATVEVSTTQTDPAGSPVWSNFEEVVSGDFRAWGILPRIRLQTEDPNQIVVVEKFRVDAKEIV